MCKDNNVLLDYLPNKHITLLPIWYIFICKCPSKGLKNLNKPNLK